MKKTGILLVAATLLIGAVSCQKEALFSRRPGDVIVFKAPYGGQPVTKDPETKATYESGTAKGNIYWDAEDVIRIYCNQAHLIDDSKKWADYVLTPQSNQAYADINNYQGGNNLYWGSGDHTFYCVYPSPVMGQCVSSIDGPAVSFSLPDVQDPSGTPAESTDLGTGIKTTTFAPDMSNAILVASTTAASSDGNGSAVNLDFKAQFTAFEFVVKADPSGSLSLTSFEFESSSNNLVAAASANISGTGDSVVTSSYSLDNPSKKITVNLGTTTAPFVLGANDIFVFTVFALAVDDITNCSIKFNTVSGYRSLALKYADDYFAANSTTLIAQGKANASGHLIFPKGKKITLMGFNVPGKFYIAFNDITIGGQPYEGKTPGTDWAFVLEEIELASATIGGHTVTDLGSDSGWDLVSYTLALEQAVINGQNVTNYSSDSAWTPILDPISTPGVTTGGQGSETTTPGTDWSLTVND